MKLMLFLMPKFACKSWHFFKIIAYFIYLCIYLNVLAYFQKTCIFYIFLHISYNQSVCYSFKKDGVTIKTVPLIGMGFLTLVDSLFWHLPFVSSKQAHAVREKAQPSVTEEDWTQKFNSITAEHKEPGAREQLRAQWKEWLAARKAGPAGSEGGAEAHGERQLFMDD
jgi:hypothetical protein